MRNPIFIEIQNVWAWADKLGRKNLRHLEYLFLADLSAPTVTVSPLSIFSINQPLFLQKTQPLYPYPK